MHKRADSAYFLFATRIEGSRGAAGCPANRALVELLDKAALKPWLR
jgi:hypothetical protein